MTPAVIQERRQSEREDRTPTEWGWIENLILSVYGAVILGTVFAACMGIQAFVRWMP